MVVGIASSMSRSQHFDPEENLIASLKKLPAHLKKLRECIAAQVAELQNR